MIPVCDNLGRRGLLPGTWLLVVAWVILFFWQWGSSPEVAVRAVEAYGLRPQHVGDGWLFLMRDGISAARLWRLVPVFTHAFIHIGPIQLLACAVFHQVFGGRVEARVGTVGQLALVVITGIVGALSCMLLSPLDRGPLVGASAVVTGQIAVAAVLCRNLRIRLVVPVVVVPVSIELPFWCVAGAWAVLQFPPLTQLLSFGYASPVPWSAHVGAALAGLALTPLLGLRLRRRLARAE